MIYDVAIIGGGPAGYTAAGILGSAGKKVILFEKQALGGVCLNEGCIPTKTLLYSAKVLDSIKSASRYGIKIEGEPEHDLKRIMVRKNKTVRRLVAGIRQKMANSNVQVEEGAAQIKGADKDKNIIITCNDTDFVAKKLILCTGSEPIVPPIDGIKDVEYMTSKEALDIKELPESITIIGGGVIGMEFASFFNSLGVKVTVVEMEAEILGAMDDELSAMLREDFVKRGIEFYMSTKVVKVSPTAVTIEKDGETTEILTEKILLSTGRRAVTRDLNLESLSLELERGGVITNAQMQTSHPNVYACGDVTGKSLLAHTAIREGEVACNHILGKEDEMLYNAIPAVIYTNPELAGVGMTAEILEEKGIKHRVIQLPMAFAGRFIAENEQVNGVFKLIVDSNDKVLGAHMLGNPASEIMVIVGMAIQAGYTLEQFKKTVFPHPTVGEIIHEALF